MLSLRTKTKGTRTASYKTAFVVNVSLSQKLHSWIEQPSEHRLKISVEMSDGTNDRRVTDDRSKRRRYRSLLFCSLSSFRLQAHIELRYTYSKSLKGRTILRHSKLPL